MIFEATITQDLVIKIPVTLNDEQKKMIRDDFASLLVEYDYAHVNGDSLTVEASGCDVASGDMGPLGLGLYRLGFEELGGPYGGIRALWSTEDIVFKVNK